MKLKEISMFAKLENRVILQYKVTTLSDLHIGGHTTIEPTEVDNPVIKNTDGFPIIPGSSLKSVFKTKLEWLLRSAGIDSACTPSKRCKPKNECPICRTFGGAEMAASIRITDAIANNKMTLICNRVAIDRQTQKTRQNVKYDTEFVPKGIVFTGTMTIENTELGIYTYAKLGTLLSLVDFFNSCSGGIGHAVSRGFGKVEIEVEKFNMIIAQDYINGKYEGTEFLKDSSEYAKRKYDAIADWSEYIKAYNSGENE